ncbi:reverse transcriptase domain, reverse transcriptase zinc-binding domain protein [Tanacetum coccineum]
MSWGWRKILQVRLAGFQLYSKVSELIVNGNWVWPTDWPVKFPSLLSIIVPHLPNTADGLCWKNISNADSDFSVVVVWVCIRPRAIEVDWYHLVWFSHHIPRHAVHLWLVIKRKLKTQDTLKQWDVGSNTDLNLLRCPLCDTQPDSHDHLFFECVFSLQVWKQLISFICMPNVPVSLSLIADFFNPLANKRTARSVIVKLVLAASCYFIWQERNNRLFSKQKRSKDQVIEAIKSIVRLKLLSCKFKKTKNVQMYLHLWKLPNSLLSSSP